MTSPASGGGAWFMVGGGWTTDLRYATENNTKEGWQLMMFKDEQWKRSNGSKELQKSLKRNPLSESTLDLTKVADLCEKQP